MIANGMRLHYLDHDADGRPVHHGTDGRPVVLFLHGGGLTAHTWDEVCPLLSDDFRCLAIDLRGHGDSEWSPVLDYGLDAHLADVEAFLDVLGITGCALVGQSLGGMIAMRYAAKHPALVSALVVVDVAPFPVDVEKITPLVDFMLGPSSFVSFDDALEAAVAFNPRRGRDTIRSRLRHSLRQAPDGQWTWKRDTRHLSRESFARIAAEIAELESEAVSVKCPTLIVRGAESATFTPEVAATFAGILADGSWTTVERAGHNVQSDNPSRLAAAIRPFLAARVTS